METWVSAYIYYDESLNDLLLYCIHPFLEKHRELFNSDTPYFFIRYPEGGDHIRLRIQTSQEEKVLALLSAHIDAFNRSGLPDARMTVVAYVPEIARYGDVHSIKWAEQLFYHSSAAVLEWLATATTPSAMASIQAIQFHVQLLQAADFPIAQQLEICDYFIDEWLRIFHPQRAALPDKTGWLATFDKAFSSRKEKITTAIHEMYLLYENNGPSLLPGSRQAMQQYRHSGLSEPQLMEAIAGIMHMTHNRLGIANSEEAYIMYCTKACLQYIQQNDAQFSA
ncbi:thiopeptide-type bacteriocin biosynthesis protein [Chitinophaga sp. RAB17]|uniref:thiopeptide-type bacteriocin biosynthesis protein n=1 Tax=Chitinophaga sp. RAB17 TaxID=3233049 RepID=UPI003F9107C1